jgi:methylglyoxal/glyoxal reductase
MPENINSRVALQGGGEIPWLGLGVYRSSPGRETQQAVEWALEFGYRHVDTAAVYRNENDVGAAIRESGLSRSELFVTTKLANENQGYDQTLRAIDRSLERLGFEFVDLYLVHWPLPDKRLESWRAMEKILERGQAKAIGVSNYMAWHLRELLEHCDVVPAVNQIELSPFNVRSRNDVVTLCREHGIVVEAYSPLTKARRLEDDTIVSIANRHDRSPAQVMIRYALEKGFVVLPKSTHRERILENSRVFDFALDEAEIERLDALDEGLATGWDPTEEP